MATVAPRASVACNGRFGREGRAHGVKGEARSAAIAEAVASIHNAAMPVVRAAGTAELVVTGHWGRADPGSVTKPMRESPAFCTLPISSATRP